MGQVDWLIVDRHCFVEHYHLPCHAIFFVSRQTALVPASLSFAVLTEERHVFGLLGFYFFLCNVVMDYKGNGSNVRIKGKQLVSEKLLGRKEVVVGVHGSKFHVERMVKIRFWCTKCVLDCVG